MDSLSDHQLTTGHRHLPHLRPPSTNLDDPPPPELHHRDLPTPQLRVLCPELELTEPPHLPSHATTSPTRLESPPHLPSTTVSLTTGALTPLTTINPTTSIVLHIEEDDVVSNNFNSPLKVMKEWIPVCEDEFIPKEGMMFDDLKQCEDFYKAYAHHVGFSVRKCSCKRNNQGIEKYKYFVCSKEGFVENSTSVKSNEKTKIRKRKLTREGCNALGGFKITEDGRYVLFRFHEGHTHPPSTPKKRHMLKSNDRVKIVHRTLFKSFTRANIGPSKAHRIIKEQVGGFEYVGCSKGALKIFQRDLKVYIKDSDAHMFIENFKKKREANKSFYFAYELYDDRSLKHVFWADGIARRNYALYGDVVSFDTTYDTNRYKMIFAPFTGIDNHRLSVSFGAALLGNEKAESFIWLFEKFLDAMCGHKPICIITDQDPAMKQAIQKVFDTTTHRFCLWHIMRKVSEKVGVVLNTNGVFNIRFKSCVYNSETPMEFEENWQSIIEEFGLTNNDWFSHMFVLCEMWIPAYFRDVFLGAVLRTTSRSESENSFFNNFTNSHLSLIEFWIRFESAIELQRYGQLQKDFKCDSSFPELKTDRDLEKHTAKIYTYSNFYIFQAELWVACMGCEIEEKKETNEGLVFTLMDTTLKNSRMRRVLYNPLDHVAYCSCKMFVCEGIPCRHILFILKAKLHELPSYYILNRWTKMAKIKSFFDVNDNVLEWCSQMNLEEKLISNSWMEFMTCLEVAGRDHHLLTFVANGIENITKQLRGLKVSTSASKVQEIEFFIGSSAPEQIEILPPKQANTKGSGKRIKGGKEKAMEEQKRKRLCKSCGEQAYHDSRNCPSKIST